MARSPAKARSASRGRPAKSSPKKTPAKTPKAAKKVSKSSAAAEATPKKASTDSKMDYSEGDKVMARWPGTSLYFKAKVNFVRDDDNEYDVQYEDGTVFTIPAKDVRAQGRMGGSAAAARKKTPSRSRSRGRSPARKAKASPARSPATTASSTRGRRSAAATKAPKPEHTPTRTSARIAQAKVDVSDDEGTSGRKAIPNPEHPKRSKKGLFDGLSLDWVPALFWMVLSTGIMLSLHTLAKQGVFKLQWPALSRKAADYWNREAFMAYFTFMLAIRFLGYLPIGSTVKSVSGITVRMNGFYTMLAVLAVVPGLVYRKVDLSFVAKNYFHLMTSGLMLAAFISAVAYFLAAYGKKANSNPRGNTGNPIVDFFKGREFNPSLMGNDLKLQTYRYSMIGLALLNVLLVVDSVNAKKGEVNPAVLVSAALQVFYAMDAMFFEETYFFSHDAVNSGFGFSLVSAYFSFPFLPTLVTRYNIAKNPILTPLQSFGILTAYALGYVIYRGSETQRVELAKNPSSLALKNLKTVAAAGGKKILAGGWWGLVRHPNLLGEILMQWSWVLAAAAVAGRADLLVYYLPVFTTLTLFVRARELNARNKRKYGVAWDSYTKDVSSNIVPFVY